MYNYVYNYERFRLGHYDLFSFPGPQAGQDAPDFEAITQSGESVRLSDYRGRWVVLETGSVTCNMYSRNVQNMAALRQRFPDVEFLLLYVREAHPGSNLPQHQSMAEKRRASTRLKAECGETRPVLLDDLAGTAHRLYGEMPNVVYVIDPNGKVIYRHDWVVVQELTDVLQHRDKLYPNEHAFTSELKVMNFRTNYELFKTVGRGGWNAIWDLVRAMPGFVIEHSKVDKFYRNKVRDDN